MLRMFLAGVYVGFFALNLKVWSIFFLRLELRIDLLLLSEIKSD
jgi:hypothetical protein